MKKVLFILSIIFLSIFIFGKEKYSIATTSFGEKVILYENGTWEYLTENSTDTCPLKIINGYLEKGDYNITKKMFVIVKNVSKKNVRAFKLKYKLYDDFGEKVSSIIDADILMAQELNIKPEEEYGYYSYWSLYETKATHFTVWVTIVIFTDGTRWELKDNKPYKYSF
ncbi:hypothetical protein SAMN02745164_00476 [Marinitoga hydrogenitolerans DSM 16785]|uniref:Uncharacterized protein n=1 Tax=Marinitoga hydrogenitolerans (strain DSM 16785 / JCM 12826 / AT1271) TaxID=1122195 RepID=A0A1M4TQF8_MARH1|nr:hypothetical protein [Marinitoga hydrogenitolerans]SHE46749.1 hypothetical protein SAMN02745164_00476 [Marinitoga hydrogenitolerans DSM 16785]